MATKINTTYYGLESSWTANSSWGDDCKRADSQHTFLQLAKNGDLDLANEGNINFTAVPWGVPRCSVTSWAYPLHCSQGAGGDFKGTYTPINDDLDDKNNPLVIVSDSGADISYNSGGTASTNRAYQKARIIGGTNLVSNQIVSTLTADEDTAISSYSNYGSSIITYLNYQTTKVIIDNVYLINEESVINAISSTNNNYKVLKFSALESADLGDEWRCIGFTCKFIVNNNLASDGTLHPTFTNFHKTPLHIRNNYSGGTLEKWIQYNRNVIKSIGRPAAANVNSSSLVKYEDVSAIANLNNYAWGVLDTSFCNASQKEQVFDDVSYTWEMAGRYASGTNVVWYRRGQTIVGTSSSNKIYSLLKFEENNIDNIIAAIMHEVAFLGFPFITDADDINKNIGDPEVCLPIFDYDHMITTGRYTHGADSLRYNNALWQNIFDDNIPDWDPTYEPPEGGDVPEGDSGDLSNRYLYRHSFTDNLTVYALTQPEFVNFVNDINGLYLNDPDDTQLKLDFKGSNPTDYIVGCYGVPFTLQYVNPNAADSAIQIGPVTLPNAKGKIVSVYSSFYRDCGVINFNDIPFHGDFRDYEPYTQIELYLPMCGTIQLDPAQVIGHSISIEYIYDVVTMTCTACVYRDDYTLIHTASGSIAATLPMSAASMGSYQDAVKATENAIKQNTTRVLTGAAVAAVSIGAAIATGGVGAPVVAGALGGASAVMTGYNTAEQLDYELQRKRPQISTVSSASGAVGMQISTLKPHLWVRRAEMLDSYDAAKYGHTVGFATVKNTTIGAETTDGKNSLIVCSNADLSGIPATAAEISAIQSLLTGGIYV